MQIRNYLQSIEFLNSFTDYEKESKVKYTRDAYDLDRIAALCKRLGNPQDKYPKIHITGTKGKGSTAIILHDILKHAGYKTGLYTSPHLVKINERIVVNGRPISDKDFAQTLESIRPAVMMFGRKSSPPTFFEILTAMAFSYFAKQNIDTAVIEVGMGGRLDTTNIIKPILSIITNVDYDHTDKLGKTIPKIAFEKAGIIKAGIPAITSETKPVALKVIDDFARLKRAPLLRTGKDFYLRDVKSIFGAGRTGSEFTVETLDSLHEKLFIPALGTHQAMNAATAVCAVDILTRKYGFSITDNEIRTALKNVRLPGRAQIISHSPLAILDASHNPVSMRALKEAIRPVTEKRKVILILGIARDKDVRKVLSTILPVANVVIFTKSQSPRACEPKELRRLALRIRPNARYFTTEDVRSAAQMALAACKRTRNSALVITGSFYVAGETAGYLNPQSLRMNNAK
ncbi:MAG: bifunctional folylpolyglutamate synthase/dihydrofolate synthase [Planctomycetes bacterium]|nr:bifunctional folylpolyglutamate synthase/dihydrofolate synthase [Planctomycetota bacterium]